jgi:multidrug efflux system outer membrane protein
MDARERRRARRRFFTRKHARPGATECIYVSTMLRSFVTLGLTTCAGVAVSAMAAAQAPIGAAGKTSASASTLIAAAIAPSVSASVVDLTKPAAVPTPTRSVAGWAGLWAEIDKRSVDVRVALAELERAEAATRVAWGAALPTLTGLASWTHYPPGGGFTSTGSFSSASSSTGTGVTSGTGSSDTLTMQLQLAAPLISVRNWHAIATARANEDVNALSLTDVRRKLALGLARAAVSIAAAERSAQQARTDLAQSMERLGLTQKQLASGVGDMRDLVRAQQDVATTRASIAPADEALRQAREGLAALLGAPDELGIDGDSEALAEQILGFCGASSGASERTDVEIAKRNITIAERNVDDITLAFVPTLGVQFNVGMVGPAMLGPFNGAWSISGVLSVPFYDGGVRYGQKRDRVALVEEAKARLVSAQVGAEVEIAQGRRAVGVAEAAAKSAREARDLAKEADRLARLAYQNGVGTNFDLIDAGRTLRTAESTLVLRDLDVARARLSLPFLEGRCAGLRGH